MPLRWEILHSEKLIHVVAEGEVTLKEMEAHFDALVVADALAYSKLFDATLLNPVYDDADVMAMGARLSAYTSHFPSGPLAVVGRDESVVMAFRRFVNISPSDRPAAIFKTEAKARAWLATQARPGD
ncbi:MAG: STAS/SEC14 domain-containing protein [Rhodospirillales bacterium]|nr:STAS/SEC14 domain-containing protein [Rhodospirillales bacterium]